MRSLLVLLSSNAATTAAIAPNSRIQKISIVNKLLSICFCALQFAARYTGSEERREKGNLLKECECQNEGKIECKGKKMNAKMRCA